MGINERTNVKFFPSCGVMVDNPVVCTDEPSIQEMAKALQAGQVSGKGAIITGGRIYTDATAAEIGTYVCDPV